jgi:hypothetical protein
MKFPIVYRLIAFAPRQQWLPRIACNNNNFQPHQIKFFVLLAYWFLEAVQYYFYYYSLGDYISIFLRMEDRAPQTDLSAVV